MEITKSQILTERVLLLEWFAHDRYVFGSNDIEVLLIYLQSMVASLQPEVCWLLPSSLRSKEKNFLWRHCQRKNFAWLYVGAHRVVLFLRGKCELMYVQFFFAGEFTLPRCPWRPCCGLSQQELLCFLRDFAIRRLLVLLSSLQRQEKAGWQRV